jgi:hypothetical protein
MENMPITRPLLVILLAIGLLLMTYEQMTAGFS